MIEIILLLVGGEYLQRRWAFLVVIGVVWLAAGLFLCIDAIDGTLIFPLEGFALLVLLECLVAFSLARSGLSAGAEAAPRPGGSLGPGRDPDPVAVGSGRHPDRPVLAAAFAVDG